MIFVDSNLLVIDSDIGPTPITPRIGARWTISSPTAVASRASSA
jgi:hypothetical protein